MKTIFTYFVIQTAWMRKPTNGGEVEKWYLTMVPTVSQIVKAYNLLLHIKRYKKAEGLNHT